MKWDSRQSNLLLLPKWPLTDGALTLVQKQQYFAKKATKLHRKCVKREPCEEFWLSLMVFVPFIVFSPLLLCVACKLTISALLPSRPNFMLIPLFSLCLSVRLPVKLWVLML